MCDHCASRHSAKGSKSNYLNLSQLSRDGYHFCRTCNKVCYPTADVFKTCNWCGSHKVQWNPPLPRPTVDMWWCNMCRQWSGLGPSCSICNRTQNALDKLKQNKQKQHV